MESKRPVAGEYQAGCRPMTGSRRASSQGKLRMMIPSRTAGWPDISKFPDMLPDIVIGLGVAPTVAVGLGVAVAGC
jgi:hypothetical protein